MSLRSDEIAQFIPQRRGGAEAALPGAPEIAKRWTMPVQNWKDALNRFAMVFENRLPVGLSDTVSWKPWKTKTVFPLFPPAVT